MSPLWPPPGSGTGGAVDSVNGQTGTVVLGATDVGAAATTHASRHAAAGADPVTLTAAQISDLGTSATRNVGTTAGTVPDGADSRIVAGGTAQQPWVPVTVTAAQSPYTATSNQLLLVDCTAGPVTVTLPSPAAGARVDVKKTDPSANAVTVSPSAGTIDGAASMTLSVQWHALDAVGTGAAWVKIVRPAKSSIVDYRAPQVDTHTSSVSGQTTPTGIAGAILEVLAAAGGGGSGRRGAAGTIRGGGGGGGSGGFTPPTFLPASWFSSTYSVTVGAGGTGGLTVTANDTNGNSGGTGGSSSVSSGSNSFTAYGGGGGTGGTVSGSSGGQGGAPFITSGAGGSSSGGAGVLPSRALVPPGSSGGGITASDVASVGQAGRGSCFVEPGGSAGAVDGATPGAGTTVAFGPGSSPGSGAASITTAAQSGGASPGYGAGGAGGGASLNGNNSGAGGPGGQGWVRIQWLFW